MLSWVSLALLSSLVCGSAHAVEDEEGIRFLIDADVSHGQPTEVNKGLKERRLPDKLSVDEQLAASDFINPDKRWELGLIGGVGANTYNLNTSTGYSIKMPPALGPHFGISAFFQKSASLQFLLDATEERRKFKTVTGITSGPLEVKDRVISLSARVFSGTKLYIEPFYRWKMKLVDEVRPIAVMTASQQHGLGLKVGMQVSRLDRWRNSVSLGLHSPIFYKERFQRTGNSRFRMGGEVENRFRYFVNQNLYLGVGAKAQVDLYSHSGRGDRSLSDTKERWLSLSVPFEVGGRF